MNLIIFLSIQLPNAENHRIKYIHNPTSNKVLNIVIKCQSHTGSHLILLWINQKIQAQIRKAIIKFFILTFENKKRHQIGIRLHTNAEIKISRFVQEDSMDI